MKAARRGATKVVLYYLGLDKTETNVSQLDVMVSAMEIFQERTQAHGDLWKEGPSLEQAFQVKHKAHRMLNAALRRHCEGESEDNELLLIDSALDLINYAVFTIRQLEEERGTDGQN
jgi:hypothetical protein